MNREVHVRFWEGVEVKFSCATQLIRLRHPAQRIPIISPKFSLCG